MLITPSSFSSMSEKSLGLVLIRIGFLTVCFQRAVLGQVHPFLLGTECYYSCCKSASTDGGDQNRALLPVSKLDGQKMRGRGLLSEKETEPFSPVSCCLHVVSIQRAREEGCIRPRQSDENRPAQNKYGNPLQPSILDLSSGRGWD